MLHFTARDGLADATSNAAYAPGGGLELSASFRGGWWIVLTCLLVGLAAAGAIVATSETTYITSARVLFDPRSTDRTRQTPEREQPQYAIDSAQLESQIQLLKSEQISRPVIEAHELDKDATFLKPRFSLRSLLRPLLTSEHAPSSSAYNAVSIEFDNRLDVRRLGQSYVLQISFQSTDPLEAARLTNSVTAAYIARQVASRMEAAQRNSQFERPIRELNAEGAIVADAVKTGIINIDTFPAADARVISAALTPTGPSTPRTTLTIAFGGALGLLLGSALAIMRHNLRKPVLSRSHIEQQLNLDYLGSLKHQPRRWVDRRRPGQHVLDAWGIHLMAEPRPSAASIDLRSIRTSFDMSLDQRGGQCIGITSIHAGEGKTATAQGLALAFAAASRRTLLIDANPLNPTLSRRSAGRLQTRPTVGFAQVLAGDDLTTAIFATKATNLFFMPIGDDCESISFSDKFATDLARDLFRRLREHFDRVVIDLPDFSALSDALAIGAVIDSYILVIEAGRTGQHEAAQMIATLKGANANVAGAVLNRRRSRSKRREPHS